MASLADEGVAAHHRAHPPQADLKATTSEEDAELPLYASTFNRTVWRLYGGSKGLMSEEDTKLAQKSGQL